MPTTIYNQAQLSYNDNVIRSNTVSAMLVETVSATKTPINQTYGSGDRVTYVVNLTNSGTAPFTGLTVTDNLGEFSPASIAPATVRALTYVPESAAYFINGAFAMRPTVTSTAPLTVTGLNLPGNSNAALVYEADINEFAPLDTDGKINNVAVVTGAGITEPIPAAAQITASDEPRLSITKSVMPSIIPENGRITYTFTIENMGNAEAADTVYVSDTFTPILADVTVSLNGTPLVNPTEVTYDPDTGVLETVPGVITVPAATFAEDPTTGATIVTPGSVTLTVSGTV